VEPVGRRKKKQRGGGGGEGTAAIKTPIVSFLRSLVVAKF